MTGVLGVGETVDAHREILIGFAMAITTRHRLRRTKGISNRFWTDCGRLIRYHNSVTLEETWKVKNADNMQQLRCIHNTPRGSTMDPNTGEANLY